MNWLLLILVIVVMIVVSKLVHFKHFKHKISLMIIILVLAFLYFSFTMVVKNNSIDLKTASGIFSASKIYFSWLIHAFGNVKEISGNIIKMDWLPNNSSSLSSWDSSLSSSGSGDGW